MKVGKKGGGGKDVGIEKEKGREGGRKGKMRAAKF